MSHDVIEEKQYDVTDYWPDLKLLPENVVNAFRVISDEISAVKGISTQSIKDFAKTTRDITVLKISPEQGAPSPEYIEKMSVAINLIHYVGENIKKVNHGLDKNVTKGGFMALLEQENPDLLKIHDARNPRVKGAYQKNTVS